MPQVRSLNPEQVEAVTHGEGPLLIIAGAGTGKTMVITERIQHLILKKNISPNNILALTFTEKAATEMQERVDVLLPYGYSQMWIDTFHGFCDRVLRLEAFHIGLDASYTLMTEAEAVQFFKKNLFKFSLSYFRPLGNPNKFIQAILQHFSRLKDEDISPTEYFSYVKKLKEKKDPTPEEKEEREKTEELANAYNLYEELKIQESVMDFSDLIAYTLLLFRQRKSILAKYQKLFSFILIDEFQDTNFAQNQLAILLTGKKQNITVVGDDDQAIYRWRGAAISNMIQFTKHFPKTKIVTLTKNYRSTQAILDSAYTLIQYNNPDRLEVKEHIDKKLISLQKKYGTIPELLIENTEQQEADVVVKKIEELMRKGNYRYKDFAILVRANDHALSFIKAFEFSHIPYQFLGPGQLFQQEEVKDFIAYLKVLANFEDSVSLYRVLCMPIFSFPATVVATLLNTAKRRNISLFALLSHLDSIAVDKEAKESLETLFDLMKSHLKLAQKESAGGILFDFITRTGLKDFILNPQSSVDEEKAMNMTKFLERIKKYESQQETTSLFSTVDWIDLSTQIGEGPVSNLDDTSVLNAVNILTIHASKGLEFPVVFLVNLVTDRFPTRERKEILPVPDDLIKEILPQKDYHLEEERRLFYVGITRAKQSLFLTSASFYGEGKRERKVSPFVLETIGLEAVEEIKNNGRKGKQQLSFLDELPVRDEKISEAQVVKTPLSISYLSYSQIQTFDICPLHYKLKYILKIPTPATAATAFGTSIHSALRDFYLLQKSRQTKDLPDLKHLLEHVWISEGYNSPSEEQHAFEKALKLLIHHVQIYFNPDNLPLELELPFEFFIEKLKVSGRIDRIDKVGTETVEIIDYKTGTHVPDEKELKKNLQLTTYALALVSMREFNWKPENIILSLYYLEVDKKISTTRTKEQLEEAKNIFVEKAQEIAISDFACSKSFLCKTCEYHMLCSAS